MIDEHDEEQQDPGRTLSVYFRDRCFDFFSRGSGKDGLIDIKEIPNIREMDKRSYDYPPGLKGSFLIIETEVL